QMLDHGLADMEKATLDLHLRPECGDHGFQGAVAVDDGNLWWCHSLEHEGPRGNLFTVAELPVDDVFSVECGQGAVAVEVGAIEHEVPMLLAGLFQMWLDSPAPCGGAMKGAPRDP